MITITKAQVDDTREIQMILYRIWLVTYPNKEAGITLEDIEERFRERLTEEAIEKRKQKFLENASQKEFFLVAKDGDTMVGVCGIWIKEEYNQLWAIYVLPEYQGKGIGRMFWNEVVRLFDPEKKIIVQVATYNEKAIGFYKKLGFVDNGKRFVNEQHTQMPISGACIPEMEMEIER
jgi:ribosomal protein S18 acetylase RimI-like enzyme